MNIASLNPFSSAIDKAKADITRIEAAIVTRANDLDALNAKVAAARDALSLAIEAGRSTDDLELSIAKLTLEASGKNVGIAASQSALARAKGKLAGLEHDAATDEARKGLIPRQKAIQETEAAFHDLCQEASRTAARHARACEEERAILVRLVQFGEEGLLPTGRNLQDIAAKAVSTCWANGPGAVETIVRVSVRGNDSPALDSLFP